MICSGNEDKCHRDNIRKVLAEFPTPADIVGRPIDKQNPGKKWKPRGQKTFMGFWPLENLEFMYRPLLVEDPCRKVNTKCTT